MIASTLLLSAACIAATGSEKPFQPLLDHLARQHGNWHTDNAKIAAAFYRSLDAIPKDKEKAIVDFVGTDFDRAYCIASYLVYPEYLQGHKPQPYLALTIWANESEYIAGKKRPSGEDKSDAGSLNYLAAIEAERNGLHSLAVAFKKRAEATGNPGAAVSGEEMDIYDTIKIK